MPFLDMTNHDASPNADFRYRHQALVGSSDVGANQTATPTRLVHL